MTLQLTDAAVHAMMPHCPQTFVDAIVAGQDKLAAAGALESTNRIAYLFANVAEESGEYREDVENINYTAARACAVWPSRFHSVGDVYAKVGSWAGDPEFHVKLMDNVYGNRMGNRTGTHDGSQFIGRGGLQLTGREEYGELAQLTGLDLVNDPELAAQPETQDAIIAAYVKLRGLNAIADRGDFTSYVRRINGGTIGMSTRLYYLSHILPIATAMSRGQITVDHSVARMQHILGVPSDGRLGPQTSAALLSFQKDHGLQADGIPGPLTWAELDKAA